MPVVSSQLGFANGLLVVFDLTKRGSFLESEDWINRAQKRLQDPESVPVVLVGNKLDLCEGQTLSERQVENAEASRLSENKFGCRYFETSAKEDINVREMISYIMERTY